MDPISGNTFLMNRSMVALAIVSIFATQNMYAARDVLVSLCPETDENIRVTVYQGEAHPIQLAKDKTYTIKVDDKISMYVFSNPHGTVQSYRIKPSTTALVLKPEGIGSGTNVQVRESSQNIISSAISLIAWLFIQNE